MTRALMAEDIESVGIMARAEGLAKNTRVLNPTSIK